MRDVTVFRVVFPLGYLLEYSSNAMGHLNQTCAPCFNEGGVNHCRYCHLTAPFYRSSLKNEAPGAGNWTIFRIFRVGSASRHDNRGVSPAIVRVWEFSHKPAKKDHPTLFSFHCPAPGRMGNDEKDGGLPQLLLCGLM
jgi:hypothetical protein